MKTLLLALSLAVAGVSTATAQIYQPNVVNGSILGGIAGAIIGGHNHDRWGEGAILGAVAGGLIGSAVQPARSGYYQQEPVPVVRYVPNAPVVQQAPGYGYYAGPPVYAPAAPQVVYIQQPAEVVYVPCYANPPAAYYYDCPSPSVSLGFGYWSGPHHRGYGGHGYRRW